MSFKFNPITGNLDLISSEAEPVSSNVKLQWALNSIRSFDKNVTIDETIENGVNIKTAIYESAENPDVQMNKKFFIAVYNCVRFIYQVEYTSPVFNGIGIRKIYKLSPSYKRLGYFYEVF